MGKKYHDKLKNLNLDTDERFLKNDDVLSKKKVKKENWFAEHKDFMPTMLAGAATTIGVNAASGAGMGALMALLGTDVGAAALAAGKLAAAGSLFSSMIFSLKAAVEAENPGEYSGIGGKLGTALLVASILGTVPYGVMGGGIGIKTHKLTTLAINKLKSQHQIERTVEPAPMPVIDEIQIEK